jgi:hypothetical protein
MERLENVERGFGDASKPRGIGRFGLRIHYLLVVSIQPYFAPLRIRPIVIAKYF